MAYANGRAPASSLRAVQGGMQLPLKAADAWDAMFAAAAVAGIHLSITYQSAPWLNPPRGTGAYRDYDLQAWMYANRQGRSCAAPGYSVHGTEPGCVDINNELVSKVRTWLNKNAVTYGWRRTISSEPWHFQYDGTTVAGGGTEPFPTQQDKEEDMLYSCASNGPAGSGIMAGYLYIQGADGVLRPIGQKESLAQTSRPGVFIAQYSGADIYSMAQSYGIMQVVWNGLQPMYSGVILRGNPLAPVPSAAGSFTADDRAALLEIPTNDEIGQALTSTVSLVNEHADANKTDILGAIGDIDGGASSGGNYNLSLNIPAVPGTATGTATPQ